MPHIGLTLNAARPNGSKTGAKPQEAPYFFSALKVFGAIESCFIL